MEISLHDQYRILIAYKDDFDIVKQSLFAAAAVKDSSPEAMEKYKQQRALFDHMKAELEKLEESFSRAALSKPYSKVNINTNSKALKDKIKDDL